MKTYLFGQWCKSIWCRQRFCDSDGKCQDLITYLYLLNTSELTTRLHVQWSRVEQVDEKPSRNTFTYVTPHHHRTT